MRKKLSATLLAVVMAVGMLPLSACSGGTSAATMHLRRTEGTVAVSDGAGKDVPLLDNLGLYSGYGVGTRAASYAWVDLDDVKLAKLDQNSEISIQKEGKVLNIEIKSGSLFFNVTEPLEDDETMNIRASTMLVGIRGTCGWVEALGGSSRVYLLEGKVECSAGTQTVRVNAGEMAELTPDGKLAVEQFDEQDLPVFVREELDDDADADPAADSSDAPEPTESEEPTESGPPLWSYIGLTRSEADNVDYYVYAEEPITIYDLYGNEQQRIDGYYVLSQETQLTVSNLAEAEDDCYLHLGLTYYQKNEDGSYTAVSATYIFNGWDFGPYMMPDDSGYRPGESATFTIPDDGFFYYLSAMLTYPDSGQNGWRGWYFLLDDEAAARMRQEQT